MGPLASSQREPRCARALGVRRHIHSSLFRRAVERHDPQVYDHHTTDYKQPMIFPLGERLARLFSISK